MFIHGGTKLNKTVEKGKTLLVDGPASVTINSGKVEVFGFLIKDTRKIVIREGKRLPFAVEETANFSVSIGAEAGVIEVEGNTIPQSWFIAYGMLREIQKKPVTVMVIGGSDFGKTSFCTYLTNKLVSERYKVTVLDEDLGQSDIGPPGTVAYAVVDKPVTDLFNLKPSNTFFVGANSPRDAENRTIEGAAFLKSEIMTDQKVDFIFVNTDGWTGSEEAVQFKSRLATAVLPDVVFCLQANEVPSLCATLGDALAEFKQERAESPTAVRERSREKRRDLRELGYCKYLENARVKVFALNHIIVEGKEDNALIWQRRAKDVLIALYDLKRKFLGIGILRDIDYIRKSLKVFTSVEEKPAIIQFGKIRLDENLHEISEKPEQSRI
jgi:polynucleotide 5'-hydroxyl-kinase GRC3/NOL9